MEKLLSGKMPKLIAFDLDYTLWDLWIDTHVSGPLRREGESVNEILDQFGEKISFYPEVPEMLRRLKGCEGLTIAAASRTHAPELARDALRLMLIPTTEDKEGPLKESLLFFDELQMYPGSKLTHFKKIHESTGIAYEEMVFFDDEKRNKEVAKLGVTFHLVKWGMSIDELTNGISKWRERDE